MFAILAAQYFGRTISIRSICFDTNDILHRIAKLEISSPKLRDNRYSIQPSGSRRATLGPERENRAGIGAFGFVNLDRVDEMPSRNSNRNRTARKMLFSNVLQLVGAVRYR